MIDLNRPRPPAGHGARERALRESIEAFFFGYRAFTAGPDAILARRGLGRVHHRVLYFVGRDPGLSVARLLGVLAVSKQALNGPLRQLVEAGLISARQGPDDRRVKQLTLTAAGRRLEAQLTGTQLALLGGVFEEAGASAEAGWLTIMQALDSTSR